MFWILVLLVVIFAGAMIFVAMSSSSAKPKTREDFLAALVKHTEGARSAMPGEMNSFRIDFDFEGRHFWYEDIESEGFTQKVYKGILKTKSNTNMNLVFSRKDRKKLLGGDVQMMSNLSDASVNKHSKVYVPPELGAFDVFTSEPYKVNVFLEDKKARSMLAGLKQIDRQGDPWMPVSVSEGVLFLDLSADERVKLSRPMLMENMPVLEKLTDSMAVLVKAIDKTNQT